MDSNISSTEISIQQVTQEKVNSCGDFENREQKNVWKLLQLGNVFILVWIFSTSYLLWQERNTAFMGDESGWIDYGMLSAEILLKGDFSREAWEFKSVYGEINLPLGKLIIGLPLLLYARAEGIPQFRQMYDFKKSYDENVQLGKVPPQQLLYLARAINAVLGGLICMIFFMTAYSLSGWVSAIVSVLLILSNRFFVTAATQALTDMSFILFLILGVGALLFFIDCRTWRCRMGAAAVCGLFGGLASCVKFMGLPLLGFFFVLLLCLGWMAGRVTLQASVGYLLVTATLGMAVVYLLTPNYWPRLGNADASALAGEMRQLLVEGKKIPIGGSEKDFMAIATEVIFQRKEIRATFPQISSALLPPAEFFFLPMRWNNQFDRYQEWRKVEDPSVYKILYENLVKYRSFRLELLLLFGGLIYCAYITWTSIRGHTVRKESLICLFYIGYVVFLTVTMRVSADRYHLPSILISAIICGLGVSALLQSRVLVSSLVRMCFQYFQKTNSTIDCP